MNILSTKLGAIRRHYSKSEIQPKKSENLAIQDSVSLSSNQLTAGETILTGMSAIIGGGAGAVPVVGAMGQGFLAATKAEEEQIPASLAALTATAANLGFTVAAFTGSDHTLALGLASVTLGMVSGGVAAYQHYRQS